MLAAVMATTLRSASATRPLAGSCLAAPRLQRLLTPLAPRPRAASIFTRAQQHESPTGKGSDTSKQQQQQQQQQKDEQQLSTPDTTNRGEMTTSQRGGMGGSMMMPEMMMPTPFRRMADHMFQMQREMDAVMNAFGLPDPFGPDLFERAAAPLVARRAPGALAGSPMAAAARLVPLEVEEDDKGYTVTAEVPGFDKNEIKVTVSEDGMLTMTGTHQDEATTTTTTAGTATATLTEEGDKAKGEMARPRSRRFASFVRSVSLPDDADRSGISATTQHGVLCVRIPKTPVPQPKVHEVPIS